jgi:hypothetical protein
MRTRVALFGVLAGILWLGVTEAGEIVGTVRLTAKAPVVEPLRPTDDHAVCGAEPRPSEALILSPSGGVKNAVISIAHERMGSCEPGSSWRPTPIAVTDVSGQFRLSHLPPGPHILEVWHELLGTRRLPISVGMEGEVRVKVLGIVYVMFPIGLAGSLATVIGSSLKGQSAL